MRPARTSYCESRTSWLFSSWSHASTSLIMGLIEDIEETRLPAAESFSAKAVVDMLDSPIVDMSVEGLTCTTPSEVSELYTFRITS